MPNPNLNSLRHERVLVTGATGFVGSCLVHTLGQLGTTIGVTVRKTSDLWRLRAAPTALTVLQADLTDYAEVSKMIHEFTPDIVFHLATFGGLAREQDDGRIARTNIMACANLLMALADSPRTAFINAGSSSEYGPRDEAMREDDVPAPETSYGKSKLMATLLTEAAARTLGRPAVTLRLFSPYGCLEDPGRLIPSVIFPCLTGEPIRLGAANSVRDFVFIDDVVEAFIAAAVYIDKAAGQVINIGSGRQHSVGDVVATVRDLTGCQADPKWGALPSPRHEPSSWKADITKAGALLDWRPRNDMKTGLTKTVDWYRANMGLYEAYRQRGETS